jgi:hypothetical protein
VLPSRSGKLGGIQAAWPVVSTEMAAGVADRSPAASPRERHLHSDEFAGVLETLSD